MGNDIAKPQYVDAVQDFRHTPDNVISCTVVRRASAKRCIVWCRGAACTTWGSEATVWGGYDGLYTTDSSVCRCARHAGLVPPTGGVFLLEPVGSQPVYQGSMANGVSSRDYGRFEGWRVLPCGVSLEEVTRLHTQRTNDALCEAHANIRRLPPMAHVAHGMQSCTDESNSALSRANGLVVRCVGRTCTHQLHTVWGSGPYTTDSGACAAARHAGIIGAEGGVFKVMQGPERTGYVGSTANGVTTQNWPGSWQSMMLEPVVTDFESALRHLRAAQETDLAHVRAVLLQRRPPAPPKDENWPIPNWAAMETTPLLEIACRVSLRVPAVALLEEHLYSCGRELCVVRLSASGLEMLAATSRIQVLSASFVGCDYIGITSLMFVSTACRVVLHFESPDDRRRLAVHLRRGQELWQLPQPVMSRALCFLDDASLLAAACACRWLYAASKKVLSGRLRAQHRIWVHPEQHGLRIEARLRQGEDVERPVVAFFDASAPPGQAGGGYGSFPWPLPASGGIFAPLPAVNWLGDTRAVLTDGLAEGPLAVSPPFRWARPAVVALPNRLAPRGPLVPGLGARFGFSGSLPRADTVCLCFCSSSGGGEPVFTHATVFGNEVAVAVLPLSANTEYAVCLTTGPAQDFAMPESCDVFTTASRDPTLDLSVALEGTSVRVSYTVQGLMLPFVAIFPHAGKLYVEDKWHWIVAPCGIVTFALPYMPGVPLEVRLCDENGVVMRAPLPTSIDLIP